MADGVWKGVYPHVFGRSKQLSLNKFFDPSTPSMIKGCDGGEKWGGGIMKIVYIVYKSIHCAISHAKSCYSQVQKTHFPPKKCSIKSSTATVSSPSSSSSSPTTSFLPCSVSSTHTPWPVPVGVLVLMIVLSSSRFPLGILANSLLIL